MDNLPFAQSRHDDRGAARRRVIRLAGLLVVASAAVCLPGCDPGGIEAPAAGQAASANVVVNGDFDQGMSGGAPAGWALEDDLASRGTMRVERRGQRASVLRLSPNRNNTDKHRTYVRAWTSGGFADARSRFQPYSAARVGPFRLPWQWPSRPTAGCCRRRP
jgi:hypothetical protein